MNRDFKGIWIPKEVWLSTDLSLMEKFFIVEIDSLNGEEGCYASNKHFSEFFTLSKNRCTEIIKSLEKKGFISVELKKNKEVITRRTLRIIEDKYPTRKTEQGYSENKDRGIRKTEQGYSENREGSNTKSSNTKSSNTAPDFFPEEKKEAKSKTKNQLPTIPDDIDVDLWKEWMVVRIKKKAVNSPTAIRLLLTKLDKCVEAGYERDFAITTALEKSWKSVEVEWLVNVAKPNKQQNGFPSQQQNNNQTANLEACY